MKEKIILFIKGIVLGVAFIIPGVSGGTLAVLMGIYENLIEAVSNFYKGFKNFKKYFLYLLPIALGILFSVAICAKIIRIGLDKAPIITMLVFLGLIIGGIPKLFKEVKKPGVKEIVCMLVGLLIVVVMTFVNKSASDAVLTDMNIGGYIVLFLVGALASATMVVPGISGSFTLMLIGYYEPILTVINNITSFTNLKTNILIIIPFLMGAAVGVIVIAKIIEYLLNHHHDLTYYTIIGFVLSSIVSVFYQVAGFPFNMIHLIIGLVLMCINSLFIYKVFEK